MILPISLISVALCLVWVTSRSERRSPLTLGLWAWAVAIVLPALPLLSFNVDYSLTADALVGVSLVAVTAGYSLTKRVSRPGLEGRPRALPTPTELALTRALMLVGLLGGLMLLGSAASVGLGAFSNLADIRDEAFERPYSEVSSSPIERIGALLAPAGLLAIVAVAHFGRLAGRALIALSGITGVVFLGAGLLLYGGRSLALYAALLAAIAYYLRGGASFILNRGRVALATLAIGLAIVLSIPFVGARQEGFDAEDTLAVVARAEFHPLIEGSARSEPAFGAALVSVTYFGSTVPTLAYYVEQGSEPGPFLGQYSYPLVFQAAGLATGDPQRSWVDIRREVFSPLEGAGYYGNVWATWLRDLVIDFGYLGAVLFCFMFGAFLGWIRDRVALTGDLSAVLLEAVACLTFAFGAFTSLLPFQFTAVAFFIALGIFGVARLRRKPRSLESQRSRSRPLGAN